MIKLDPQGRYTRRQIMVMTGVNEGALGFWIKEGVLTAIEGGDGRGSHRRFSPMQVSAIGLIKELQSYGVNVQQLRSFGALLQEGIDAVETCGLHPSSVGEAEWLAKYLARFRSGQTVKIYKNQSHEKEVPAKTEGEIIEYYLCGSSYHDDRADIIEFASKAASGNPNALRLGNIIYNEMYHDDISDYSIILWRGLDGGWEFGDSTEPSQQFIPMPEGRRSGIMLGVGVIIREIWDIDLDEKRRRAYIRGLARELTDNPERAARGVESEHYSAADIEAARKLVGLRDKPE